MIVYLITNKKNGKQYVGQTVQSVETRFRKHKNQATGSSSWLLHRAMRRYGTENFSVSILHVCSSKSDLDFAEGYWIRWLGTSIPEFGYNMTLGGEGTFGFKHSLESRLRMSQTRRKRQIPSSMLGRKHSAESLKKMRDSQLGKKHSEETKEKMKLSHEKRKPISEETRSKLRQAGKARKNPNLTMCWIGRKHTEETKRKISETKRKKKQ